MQNTSDASAREISDPKCWLEANATPVTHMVMNVARRRRLRPQDTDDLLSIVCAHLLKDDCRVLRRFRGTSSVSTYLTVVVERQLIDMRTAEWGKWRPSAEARRLGSQAVRFERLVARDGMDPIQARTMSGCTDGGPLSRRALPAWRTRRFVGLDLAEREAAGGSDPFEHVLQGQQAAAGSTVRRQLAQALREVTAADRVILRMRYADGLRVSQIARRLSLDQRALYSRMASLHKRLREPLTRAGLGAQDVMRLSGGPLCHVPPVLGCSRSLPGN